jgi:hypothetical protein
MIPTAVHIEEFESSDARFRAVSGKHQSVGRTAGEALDALLAQEGGAIESSAILIQRFVPDACFTQAQYDRMQQLLAHRNTHTELENAELDALIDAELEATIARTQNLLSKSTP